MVNIIKKALFWCIILFSGSLIYAQEWVIDNAQVLDNETKNQIETTLSQLNAKTHSKSFVVTEQIIRQPESVVADDLFDQLVRYQNGQNIEGTLLLIVTEDASGLGRRVYLSTSGDTTIKHINDRKIAQLTDQFANDMYGNNNYNRAVKNYVIQLDKELSASPLSTGDIAGGGLAGLLSGLLAFFRTRHRYRLPERPIPALWKNNATSEVQHSNNELIDRSTKFRIIPTTNSFGGGGGGSHTHIGSSGNRHGGGGRGF